MKKKILNIQKAVKSLTGPMTLPIEYKRLKAHLNAQPIGYPSTLTGVENRLLTEIFTPVHAKTALYLNSTFETFETIFKRAEKDGISKDDLKQWLIEMEEKGCIFVRYRDKIAYYCLHPFVVGMFEMQVYRLTPGYFMDTRKYAFQRYGIEYLTTKLPQMRVIPIERSIPTDQPIASFDHVKKLVQQAPGNLRLIPCICKVGKDRLNDPCKKTKRREVCLLFRDFAELFERHDWGREVSKQEALDMLAQSQKEGLMLMPSNMQQPQVICSCCGCCCGITGMIGSVPRPVDFTASNFRAQIDIEMCTGCRNCVKRCQMNAMRLDKKTKKPIGINPAKCIGCGVCVPVCKPKAIKLIPKPDVTIPPKDHDALYEEIAKGKKSTLEKTIRMAKAMAGIKT